MRRISLESCMELMESAISGGHKILLFSQFTSMLAIIEEALKEKQHITRLLARMSELEASPGRNLWICWECSGTE